MTSKAMVHQVYLETIGGRGKDKRLYLQDLLKYAEQDQF